MCGHFTALVWKGAKEIGCGCVTATDGSQMSICRYKAGDNIDMEVPNMQKPDNFPNHVFPLKERTAAASAAEPEVMDPNKLNPVSLVMSLNDGPFRNAQLKFSLESASVSFSYEGKAFNIQGIDINPMFSDQTLLS